MQTMEYLALLCINICRVVDPSAIVFAGGMSKAGSRLLDRVQHHINRLTWTIPVHVDLLIASTVENAGIVGAAMAAKGSIADTALTAPVKGNPAAVSIWTSTSGAALVGAFTIGVIATLLVLKHR